MFEPLTKSNKQIAQEFLQKYKEDIFKYYKEALANKCNKNVKSGIYLEGEVGKTHLKFNIIATGYANLKAFDFRPVLKKLLQNLPDRYDIGLKTDPNRDNPWTIYIQSTPKGLRYEVISIDGNFHEDIIPWNKIKKLPKQASDIINSDDKNTHLRELLKLTSKNGHTLPYIIKVKHNETPEGLIQQISIKYKFDLIANIINENEILNSENSYHLR